MLTQNEAKKVNKHFLKEYEALCMKYNLFLTWSMCDNGLWIERAGTNPDTANFGTEKAKIDMQIRAHVRGIKTV